MTKACIDNLEGRLYPTVLEMQHFNSSLMANDTRLNEHYISDDPTQARIMIGMSLAFFTGIIQVEIQICSLRFFQVLVKH